MLPARLWGALSGVNMLHMNDVKSIFHLWGSLYNVLSVNDTLRLTRSQHARIEIHQTSEFNSLLFNLVWKKVQIELRHKDHT